jgi:hypothetical protein
MYVKNTVYCLLNWVRTRSIFAKNQFRILFDRRAISVDWSSGLQIHHRLIHQCFNNASWQFKVAT